ncbi:MAG TPA: type II toxin-antitoxin system ParD family antitoxin [Allosphingosinicella sp.]|nr:type II toxin-antitoxin system ParD family antitoxin [Allosphingosinicella sp.]
MPQLNVSLPEQLKRWAESRVADGRYSSASDYIRDLMRRDQETAEQQARLQEAIDLGRRSPPSDLTIEDIIARERG